MRQQGSYDIETEDEPLCQRVARTIEREGAGVQVAPNDEPTRSSQYVDVDTEPFGRVYDAIMDEHDAYASPVKSDLHTSGAFGYDTTRIWFSEIEENDGTDEDPPSFAEYVEENVFTQGGYVFDDEQFAPTYDLAVAENDDGFGFTLPSDIENAIDDDGVVFRGVKDGWVVLDDAR